MSRTLEVGAGSAGVLSAPYPVVLDLTGRKGLVVGAGAVAARKVAGLCNAGAYVSVVAPDAVSEIAQNPAVRWHQRPYRRGEVASYSIAITATSDRMVNEQVASDAHAANVWVNSADDPDNCAFILPSVVQRGDLHVSISTNGRSPAFAQWARRRVEALFDDTHATALDIVAAERAAVRSRLGTSEIDGWAQAIDDRLFDLVAAGEIDAARQHIRRALGRANGWANGFEGATS